MKSKAFTLVELLIVVGIIGLLATIGVSAYSSARTNARNLQRKTNLSQVAKALEMYANDHGGVYPSTGGIASWRGACTTYGGLSDTGASAWIPNFSPTYMAVLPHDPDTNKGQNSVAYCQTNPTVACFLYTSNGTDYKLIAHCLPEGTLSSSDPYYDPAGRSAYSWQVSSPGGRAW